MSYCRGSLLKTNTRALRPGSPRRVTPVSREALNLHDLLSQVAKRRVAKGRREETPRWELALCRFLARARGRGWVIADYTCGRCGSPLSPRRQNSGTPCKCFADNAIPIMRWNYLPRDGARSAPRRFLFPAGTKRLRNFVKTEERSGTGLQEEEEEKETEDGAMKRRRQHRRCERRR